MDQLFVLEVTRLSDNKLLVFEFYFSDTDAVLGLVNYKKRAVYSFSWKIKDDEKRVVLEGVVIY